MKPIYFPFTYAADNVAEALAACFGQFIVYQPLNHNVPEEMQAWVNQGIMDIRVPVDDDTDELELKVKSYLNWANQQLNGSGVESGFLKTLTTTLPFYDRSISSQIVSQIRDHDHGGLTSQAPGAAWPARIFLYFAQEFDRQSHEVDRDLNLYREKQEDLIRILKMGEDPFAGELSEEQIQPPDTSTGYMISDRLEAWTRLMPKDTEGSGLFVTHSAMILDYLLERLPTAQKILSLKSIPLAGEINSELDPWRHTLMSCFTKFAENKWPVPVDVPIDVPVLPDVKDAAALTVYLVPDQIPTDVFWHCSEIERHAADEACGTSKFKNTLLGLIEL